MKSDEARRKKLYVERDISWMYFNQRILLEAARPEVPLLEQLTFLGIYSNNLDEFFRVRVATLNRIVEYGDKNIREERDTAARTLKQIGKLHNQYYRQFEEIDAGRGRSDVLMWPREGAELPPVIIELKWNRTAASAVEQIQRRNYPAVVEKLGRHREVLLVGIS